MRETKFTPGPWRHATNANFCNIVEGNSGKPLYDGDDGFRAVATVQSCCGSNKAVDIDANQFANINLISAAPELYEALNTVMQWIMNWDVAFQDDDEWEPDRDAAFAALAKALGEDSK